MSLRCNRRGHRISCTSSLGGGFRPLRGAGLPLMLPAADAMVGTTITISGISGWGKADLIRFDVWELCIFAVNALIRKVYHNISIFSVSVE